MRTLIAAACLALASTLAACGGSAPPPAAPASPATAHHDEAEHHGTAPPSGNVKAPGDAQPGDTSRCPVSGEEFVVTADSPHAEHEGKTYYFCCSGCEKRFKSDPAKYLSKPKG